MSYAWGRRPPPGPPPPGEQHIEDGEVTADQSQIMDSWRPGECARLTCEIGNTGSSCMFLTARYDGRWGRYRQRALPLS